MTQFLHQLRITEIFYSLQGESVRVGLPTVFIRLTGCPLRCQYCDTSYAFQGGEVLSVEFILARVAAFDCAYVCVTGGEPLAQPGCLLLLQQLCDAGYEVSLETSGARDISQVDSRVMIVMDMKTPDSLEADKNLLSNLNYLKRDKDQIKWVICSRQDYDWACAMILEHHLSEKAQLLFSPSWNQLAPKQLADWMVSEKLQVRFQLQLHKLLWDDTPGH
jgi:7-carboxy-7-deazaguanine synthase